MTCKTQIGQWEDAFDIRIRNPYSIDAQQRESSNPEVRTKLEKKNRENARNAERKLKKEATQQAKEREASACRGLPSGSSEASP